MHQQTLLPIILVTITSSFLNIFVFGQSPPVPSLPYSFKADFVATFLAGIEATGTLYYDYPNGRQRYDATLSSNYVVTRIELYNESQLYVSCQSACEKFQLKDEMEPYFVAPGAIFVGSSSDCQTLDSVQQPVQGTVCGVWENRLTTKTVFVYSNQLGLQKVQVIDRTTGENIRTFSFRAVPPIPPSSSVFLPPSVCTNTALCGNPQDVIFVLDSSGSIDDVSWINLIEFTKNVISSMDVGPTSRVGIVQFSSWAQVELNFTTNATTALRTLNTMTKLNNDTAIGDGLYAAMNMFNTLGRPNVTYVAILITDGEHNYGMDPFPVADTMKASGITIFGIAIGNLINFTTIERLSSNFSALRASNYSDLVSLIDILTSIPCKQQPKTPCPNDCSGYGFCGCNRYCVCPFPQHGPDCSYRCGDGILEGFEQCDYFNMNGTCCIDCLFKNCSYLDDACTVGVCDNATGACTPVQTSPDCVPPSAPITPIFNENFTDIIVPTSPRTDNTVVLAVLLTVFGTLLLAAILAIVIYIKYKNRPPPKPKYREMKSQTLAQTTLNPEYKPKVEEASNPLYVKPEDKPNDEAQNKKEDSKSSSSESSHSNNDD